MFLQEAVMEIQSSREGTATVVSVAGRMDAITAPAFAKTLNVLIDGGEVHTGGSSEG